MLKKLFKAQDVICPALGFGVLLALLVMCAKASCGDEQTLDPLALARGVETARLGVGSGRLEMVLLQRDERYPMLSPQPVYLKVVFEGERRRYDQRQRILWIDGSGPDGDKKLKQLEAMGQDREAFVRAGLGEWRDVHIRCAFDGTQVIDYSEEAGARVRDPSKGTADYVFDPRILGISVWYDVNYTVSNCLAYKDAKSVSIVGREDVGGRSAWHVKVIDAYDQQRDFWIGAVEPFQVLKCERRDRYQHLVTTANYISGGDGILPTEVLTRAYDKDGKCTTETSITVSKAELNVPVDSESWTLAGLKLPLGEAVIDQRIHQRVGYWDGEGLTESFVEAKAKGDAARWRPLTWWIVLGNGLILAAMLGYVASRRKLLRHG